MSICYQEFRDRVDAAVMTKQPATFTRYQDVHAAVQVCFKGASARARAGDLMRLLMLRHAADGVEFQPYFGIAQAIADAFNQDSRIDQPADAWARAIPIVVAHTEILYTADNLTAEKLQGRAIALGQSYKALKDIGYELDLNDDGSVLINDGHLDKLVADIDGLAKRIGGVNLVNMVLERLASNGSYDDELHRFVITRDGRPLGQVPTEPQTPWGYLFQLGVKQLASGGFVTSRYFDQLLKLCRLAVALLDVQPYSSISGHFLKQSTLTKFLQESTIYDSLFGLQQLPAADCELQLSALATRGLLDGNGLGEVPLADLPVIARCILARAKSQAVTYVTAAEIGKELRKSARNVKKIIDMVFAHATPPNQSLQFPPLKTAMEFYGRPLVAMGDGRYWCPPRSIAGKAILDAVIQAVRNINKNVDSLLGKVLEKMLVDQATMHGIQIKHGEYYVQSKKKADGDCDLVVETPEVIVFIEVKKKGLTYAAQSGADLQLLLDLTQGVASSQAQAMKHEHFVSKATLTLKVKGRGDQILSHGGRRVLRISVVSFDYGSLHDRSTIQQFLTIGCNTRIDATDPAMQRVADEVTDTLLELKDYADKVGELKNCIPFMNSVLLSIPQLLILLRRSNSNASFVNELTMHELVLLNTKDWYHHWQYSRRVLLSHSR
jgi:hypothetical protein